MEKNEEKTCFNCAYCREVPGSAHKACAFNWRKNVETVSPPIPRRHGVVNGWYFFPVNFDPSWQINPCEAFAEVAEPDKTTEPDFLLSLFLYRVFLETAPNI